jgi:putative membrane protein
MEDGAEKDPRVYFAAERTFLARIRTGLGLMGAGFAVSRFGLFLREIQATEIHMPVHTRGVSAWSGIALVLLGVVVNVNAPVKHYQIVRELSSGSWIPGRVSTSAVILAGILAAAGLVMAGYLTLVP